MIASQNRGPLAVFKQKNKSIGLGSFIPSAQTMAVIIEFENGQKERIECGYGAGFLSQSSRVIAIPANTKSITMIDYNGKSTPVDMTEIN